MAWVTSNSLRNSMTPPTVHAGGDSASGQRPNVNYPCFSFHCCCRCSLWFVYSDVFLSFSGRCDIQHELSTSMDLRSTGEALCFGVWRENSIIFLFFMTTQWFESSENGSEKKNHKPKSLL